MHKAGQGLKIALRFSLASVETVSSGTRALSSGRSAAQRLQEAVTPASVAKLQQDGWVTVDGVFGSSLSRQLRQDIQVLRDAGHMHLNCTHLVRGGDRQLLEKSSIYEADLLDKNTLAQASQTLRELQADTGFRTMLSLFLPQLRLDSQAIKLQYNSGNGGCFPIHYDSDEALDGRRISAIVYLNHDWQPSHGGHLRLYPFLESPVDIDPIGDRLVLFSSCRMAHRVLPSSADRWCFTIWLSQTRGTARPPAPLPQILRSAAKQHVNIAETWQRLLKEPDVRKSITKLVHAEEWKISLNDSHPASAARAQTMANFDQEIALLQRELGKVAPVVGELSGNQQLLETAQKQAYAWF